MRLETLNKLLLAFGFLGFGAMIGSVAGNQFLPPHAWQLGVLAGLLVMAFAVVAQVGVVLLQRRKRKARNEEWLTAFRQRSLSAENPRRARGKEVPGPPDSR